MRDIEHDARTRSEGLEAQGRLPAGFTQKHHPLTTAEQRELRRLKTAMLLADGPDTYVALAREGKAPRRWLTRRLTELGYR